MILFSYTFVKCLIFGALVLTGIGVVSLLALLLKDKKNKTIW